MTNALTKIEIIAELAQGFEGKKEQALLMVLAASSAGADAAKFQLVYADELATPDYKYYQLFSGLEMPDEDWAEIAQTATKLNVKLYLDVFGRRSLRLAEQLSVESVKLHGTDISNLSFLKDVAQSSVPRVLLGAGGAHFSEIEKAVEILAGKKVVILLGFQAYPTPDGDNQISRILTLCKRWEGSSEIQIGFADHADPQSSARLCLPCAALGAGATVFEKHLTLGRNMKLEDHESALNPDEFQEFVEALTVANSAMRGGMESDDFGMSESEKGYRRMIRRHVVAGREIPAGKALEPEDLVLKRSGIEDFVTDLGLAYGAVLNRKIGFNEPLRTADLEKANS